VKEGFNRIMKEYYHLRGWQPGSGFPTRTRLRTLGLGKVTEGLEAYRRPS
jgi:aldehyde:ferredoxin oxidoreductase